MVLRNSLGVKLIASICTPRNLNVNRLSLAMLFKRPLNNKAHKEYESLRAFFCHKKPLRRVADCVTESRLKFISLKLFGFGFYQLYSTIEPVNFCLYLRISRLFRIALIIRTLSPTFKI